MNEIQIAQGRAFDRFRELSVALSNLSRYMQNNFSSHFSDNYNNPNDLRLDMRSFNNEMEILQDYIRRLTNSTNNIFSYYIDELEKDANVQWIKGIKRTQ